MIIEDFLKKEHRRVVDKTLLAEVLHPANTPGIRDGCSLAHALLERGERSLPHRLVTSAEAYAILEGEGIMHIDDESASVRAGSVIYIPPGSRQHLENTGAGRLSFLCVVWPAWHADDEIVEAAYD